MNDEHADDDRDGLPDDASPGSRDVPPDSGDIPSGSDDDPSDGKATGTPGDDEPQNADREPGTPGDDEPQNADREPGTPGDDEPQNADSGSDEASDGIVGGAFGPQDFDPEDPSIEGLLLDEHELEHVQRDIDDLADFEAAFRPEGYRGVAVWCQDCSEEHFYPWDMLRENLQVLIETGETPVHEPAFAPEPDRYVPWDYARGYVDALRDAGVDQRLDVDACPRCRLKLPGDAAQANYCPRCAAPLLAARLHEALEAGGIDPADIETILRRTGLPG